MQDLPAAELMIAPARSQRESALSGLADQRALDRIVTVRIIVGLAMVIYILQKLLHGHIPPIRMEAAIVYLGIAAAIPLIYWRRPAPYRRSARLAQFVLLSIYLLGNGAYTWWTLNHGFKGLHWALIWLTEIYIEGAIVRGRPFDPFYPVRALSKTLGTRKALAQELAETKLQLTRVNRSLVLSALASSITHEISQPLAAVVVNAEAAKRWLSNANTEEAHKAIARAAEDGHRAGAVIASFRRLLQQGELPRASVDIGQVMEEALNGHAADLQRHNINVHAGSMWRVPIVMGDPVQLRQVFLNLIANAIDAMSEVKDRPRRLTITYEQVGRGQALFCLEDNGTGIKDAEHIWDLFFTTKSKGMGMGLFISRMIVEAHGGTLTATSQSGRTRFYVELPTETSQESGYHRLRRRGRQILTGRYAEPAVFRGSQGESL